MEFEKKTVAEFRCFEDVVLLIQISEDRFHVMAEWSSKPGKLSIEDHKGVSLRIARIEFEKLVNYAICRMTLDHLYAAIGIERPQGQGKYGLVE